MAAAFSLLGEEREKGVFVLIRIYPEEGGKARVT
jgi:hypothetical protein